MNKLHVLIVLVSLAAMANCQYYNTQSSCPLGYYSSNLTSTGCAKCSAGTSSLGYSSSYYYWSASWVQTGICQPCQSGSYANAEASSVCTQCPEGYNCAEPALPTPCKKGTASSDVNILDPNNYGYYYSSNGACTVCPSGTYTTSAGSTQCIPCSAGYSCLYPFDTQVVCPPGTISSPGQYGYYGNYGYYGSNSPAFGGFCALPNPGSYQPSSGATAARVCPEGYYCPDATHAYLCPSGTFRNNNPPFYTYPRNRIEKGSQLASGSMCFRCPQGYYATAKGSKRCTKCPKGYYCADPTVAPVRCPIGTFSNFEYGVEQCPPCPDGTYTTAIGSTKCAICPPGYFCPDAKALPRKCPAGTFSNSTRGQLFCSNCPTGTYNTGVGASKCTACPQGYCCYNSASTPVKCAAASTPSYYG